MNQRLEIPNVTCICQLPELLPAAGGRADGAHQLGFAVPTAADEIAAAAAGTPASAAAIAAKPAAAAGYCAGGTAATAATAAACGSGPGPDGVQREVGGTGVSNWINQL